MPHREELHTLSEVTEIQEIDGMVSEYDGDDITPFFDPKAYIAKKLEEEEKEADAPMEEEALPQDVDIDMDDLIRKTKETKMSPCVRCNRIRKTMAKSREEHEDGQ
jgi:hypothetical protein